MICKRLHEVLNSGLRFGCKSGDYTYPDRIIQNGIVVMYEKGEKAHGDDKVVAVLCHRDQNGVLTLLNRQFVLEDSFNGTLRKHIGMCILNRDEHPYLRVWRTMPSISTSVESLTSLRDMDFETVLEKQITQYVQDHMSFTLINVDDVQARFDLRDRLFWTVRNCDECGPSPDWLGLQSPLPGIRESGLWEYHLGGYINTEENVNYVESKLIR